MRHVALLVLAAAVLAATSGPPGSTTRAADPVVVEVTSAGDGPGTCPDPEACTLRAAIELANTAEPGTPYTITFSSAVFAPPGASILLVDLPLPAIAADDVTIDAGGLTVGIDGTALVSEEPVHGLVIDGARGAVAGVAVRGFTGSCIVLSGTDGLVGGTAEGDAVFAGGCPVALDLRGAAGRALSLRAGFGRDGTPDPVGTGVSIREAGASVGPSAGGPGGAVIGNATVGIELAGDGDSLVGVTIRGNTLGRDPAGAAAPLGTGISVGHPVVGALIRGNSIANTQGAGIAVAADRDGASVLGVVIRENTFASIGGLAVDLADDGSRQPNDPDDLDTGPNELQNHPLVVRPTTGAITGVVPGCAGCTVELYLAEHAPGDLIERSFAPITGGTAIAGSGGTFSVAVAGLPAGAWVAGLATGPAGTSEMGPAARIGNGSTACTGLALDAGWNHVTYLGPQLPLGTVYPSTGDAGAVTAIYELVDGAATYSHWFPGAAPGRTLTILLPGSTYWMFAERPVTLTAGFSFADPFPFTLVPGWNDFTYLGAQADVRDVFREFEGSVLGPFRFEEGETGGWRHALSAEAPGWVADFAELAPCGAYHVFVDGFVTITPMQP